MNLAIGITLGRIAAIPVILLVLGYETPLAHWLATLLFVLACLSDWLDGHVARRLGQSSAFGAFLDPVADKLLVSCLVIVLAVMHPVIVPLAVIIVGREILVSALREWMATAGHRDRVAVAFTGKLKTTLQMIAMSLLLLADVMAAPVFCLGIGLLSLAALLSLTSMAGYFRSAWRAAAPRRHR